MRTFIRFKQRWLLRTFLIGVLLLIGVGGNLAAQSPFSAQIQAALRVFLTTVHTWKAVQTFPGGSGTGTYKSDGLICSTAAAGCGSVAYVDAATVNQWNVMSVTLPASTLVTNGDTLDIDAYVQTATNANTKAFQLYWGGGTCSGTGASCCASGTQVYSDGTSGSNVAYLSKYSLMRIASGTQTYTGFNAVGAASLTGVLQGNPSVTDTATIPIVFCARNTSASAATLQGTPRLQVRYSPQ